MNRFELPAFLRDVVTRWDVLAFIVVIGLVVFLGETSRGLFAPLTQLQMSPISLDPWHLPEYAARTTFRMFAALALSLLFTLTYATWAAKSERAGKLLVPFWISCNRCLFSGSSPLQSCSSCRLRLEECWAPNSRPFSPSSPAKPGIWRSAFINPCAPFRSSYRRPRSRSGSLPGCVSGSLKFRSPCRRSSGT